MKKFILAHAKSLTGLLGVAISYAYQYNITHPDARVTAILGVLTVFGIYQIPNKKV